MKRWLWLSIVALATLLAADYTRIVMAGPKDTILGVALSPAHVPFSSDADIRKFFDEAPQIGSQVTWIVAWQTAPPLEKLQPVRMVTLVKGLKLHLYLDPISLTNQRRDPSIPPSVHGKSFTDPAVQQAYKDEALSFASIHPDLLGLATEVNFLVKSPREYEAFTTLFKETCEAVKKRNPSQQVTISFQWDVMRKVRNFEVLQQFGCADVFSFTTYPDMLGMPEELPADYYSSIRTVLPMQRIGFSEVGWSSASPSNEDEQALFYSRIPDRMMSARPEFITLSLMHDLKFFSGELERLNHVGIRAWDDAPKKSWDVMVAMPKLK